MPDIGTINGPSLAAGKDVMRQFIPFFRPQAEFNRDRLDQKILHEGIRRFYPVLNSLITPGPSSYFPDTGINPTSLPIGPLTPPIDPSDPTPTTPPGPGPDPVPDPDPSSSSSSSSSESSSSTSSSDSSSSSSDSSSSSSNSPSFITCGGFELYLSSIYLYLLSVVGGDAGKILVKINEGCNWGDCTYQEGDPPGSYRCLDCPDYMICYTEVFSGSGPENFCVPCAPEFFSGCTVDEGNPAGTACGCIWVLQRVDDASGKYPCIPGELHGAFDPPPAMVITDMYCVCPDGSTVRVGP